MSQIEQLNADASRADSGATRVRYQVLAAGCTLAVLTYVLRIGFTSGLPEVKRDLGLDDEQVGYLASAFLIAYGVFQVPGGLLGDRLGSRHLLTILVLAWSLLTAAVALVVLLPAGGIWPFVLLLGLRFLFGMVQAGGFPAWARVVADWMPTQERGMAQGLVWTFSRLGGVLSGFLFLGLFNLFGTWTTPFLALAGLGLLWCVVFWPWFRNRPEQMSSVNEAERELIAAGRVQSVADDGAFKAGDPPHYPRQEAASSDAVPWAKIFGSPSVWGLCLMYGFVGFAGNFITNWLPTFLQVHRKMPAETATLVFGLTFGGGLVSCILGGTLSDWIIRRTGNRKWGRRIIGLVGLGFASLASLAIPFASEVWLVGLLFCTSFFFTDIIMGPAWASCADIGERYAGTVSGAMNMIGAFAGAAGMSIAGRLLHRGEEGILFSLFAVSFGLAALCWLLVDVTKPLVGSRER